jgi:hypothetical protein
MQCCADTLPTAPSWDSTDQRLVRQLVADFPVELPLLVELASARTFASPRISAIMVRSGKYLRDAHQRNANLNVAVLGLMRLGYDSPIGRRMIAELVRIHEPLTIENEDMWYALCLGVSVPIGWLEWAGWRSLSAEEKQALFQFWRAVGLQLGLHDPPADLSSCVRFVADYERRMFAQAPQTKVMGEIARREWVERFPVLFQPVADAVFRSVIDESLGRAFDQPLPCAVTRQMALSIFVLRRILLRAIPPLRRSWWVGQWAIDRVDEATIMPELLGAATVA